MAFRTFLSTTLHVSGLAVQRDGRVLASGLDFALQPGAVLLVRGPNGAGKSTLLMTLAGLLRPAEGTVAIGPEPDASEQAIHFIGHLNAVRARLTLAETLGFWRDLCGSSGETRAEDDVISAALEMVGLGGLGSHDAGHLSQGQTRRLALARLVAAPRPVWLLDEPTAALDTGGEAVVARLVEDHRARGGIAIIATHQDIAVGGTETLTLGAA